MQKAKNKTTFKGTNTGETTAMDKSCLSFCRVTSKGFEIQLKISVAKGTKIKVVTIRAMTM